MTASKRLKPIKKLADSKEKAAAQSLGQSLQTQQRQLDKLSQLINYRAEYITNMSAKTQQGMTGDQLHQYHHFLTKLDTAILHQKQIVSESEQHLSRSQATYKSDSSRANAIGKAMNNMKVKEEKVKEKKEAMQSDELSTQAFVRQRQN